MSAGPSAGLASHGQLHCRSLTAMRSEDGGWRMELEAKSQCKRSRENLNSDTRRSSSWHRSSRHASYLARAAMLESSDSM